MDDSNLKTGISDKNVFKCTSIMCWTLKSSHFREDMHMSMTNFQ